MQEISFMPGMTSLIYACCFGGPLIFFIVLMVCVAMNNRKTMQRRADLLRMREERERRMR